VRKHILAAESKRGLIKAHTAMLAQLADAKHGSSYVLAEAKAIVEGIQFPPEHKAFAVIARLLERHGPADGPTNVDAESVGPLISAALRNATGDD